VLVIRYKFTDVLIMSTSDIGGVKVTGVLVMTTSEV
jgi:hypothetical protein